MMAGRRIANDLEPRVFDDEEVIESLAQSALELHGRIALGASCFSPTSDARRIQEMSGRIQSVLINTFCAQFGQAPADRFVDIFDQVAYLAEHMAKDHIFEDGNKRTSLV